MPEETVHPLPAGHVRKPRKGDIFIDSQIYGGVGGGTAHTISETEPTRTVNGDVWVNPSVSIGWEDWIDVNGGVGFSNSWVNFGQQDAEYRKHQDGRVQLRGFIKTGTIGQTAFTLPTGYRPPDVVHHAVASNDLFGLYKVLANGTVVPQIGSNTWFSLDGPAFDTTGGS